MVYWRHDKYYTCGLTGIRNGGMIPCDETDKKTAVGRNDLLCVYYFYVGHFSSFREKYMVRKIFRSRKCICRERSLPVLP